MNGSWQLLVLVTLVACQPVSVMPTPTTATTPAIVNTSTIVPISETLTRYELRQPQSADLLRMINSVLLMEEQMTYHEDATTFVLDQESNSLHFLIGKDFERFYLDGFPSADSLVVSDTLPWEMESFGDLISLSVVLRIAFLQYVNNHPDVLGNGKSFQLPNVNIKIVSIDINGDGNAEWLIDATREDLPLQDWFIIHQQENGRYHLLPSEINYDQTSIMGRKTEIAIIDLTGDGNPEIVKIEFYYLAGSGFGFIKIYTWKEGKLLWYKAIQLPSVPSVYGEIYASDYVIEDFNGDGLAEIRVNLPRFRRFGCQWTQSSIYYLDGRVPDVEVDGGETPQTAECLIANALESESAAEKIQLYQEALRKFNPAVSPMDKSAWIKLQLAMAYTANNDDVRADSQLQDLINMEGAGKFLKLIHDKYAEANSPSPLIFCDALYSSITSQDIPKSIGSEIDIDLTHGAYPIDFAPVANLVCPFPAVLAERLSKVKMPVSKLPIEVLTALQYSFVWSQSLNWDSDSEHEWLGVLDFQRPVLVLMNGDKNWNIDVVEIYSASQSDFEANTHTSADKNAIKVLVLFSGREKNCDLPNTVKWLVEVNPDTMEHDNLYLCDSNQYSLASESDIQRTVEEFSKPTYFESFEAPDWYYLPDAQKNEYERRTILDLVREIENDVVRQTSPKETTSRISELIASLPKDDSAAQILLSRLYYLHGLNYELSRQNELAVGVYLDLVEFSPESLWGQYAKMRIQPASP